MLNVDRSDNIQDGEFVELDEPVRAALVPVTQAAYWSPRQAPRPDPTPGTLLVNVLPQYTSMRPPG